MRRAGLAALAFLASVTPACREQLSAEPEPAPQALRVEADDLALPAAPLPLAADAPRSEGSPAWQFQDYWTTVQRVAGMTSDDGLYTRVNARGLDLLDVMWEDTGRSEGSALGPNITDLTLQVRRKDPQGQWHTAVMPVIRFPNFSDKTGDVKADDFFLRVGNEKDSGTDLETVKLTEVLKDVRKYMSAPDSIKGSGNMLAQRDTHFLVSAQAVFLPIPKHGEAEFNPVLFNYQSAPGSPAVLAIIGTRQGTSMHVIENRAEDRAVEGWGQEVYFNNRGQRASFTAQRKTDVAARIEAQGGPQTEDDRTALQKGADVIFLIQVPLVHASRGVLPGLGTMGYGFGGGGLAKAAAAPMDESMKKDSPSAGQGRGARSDVEQAVVGHGPNMGPFKEGTGTQLVRDARFPIRITVQFYKATSNGVVSNQDLAAVQRAIGDVYKHADFVGSLVVPEGDRNRPTAWQKVPTEWFAW
jgi:hypothetical protein